MQFDLGSVGLGLLIVLSLGFGVIAQVVVGRSTSRWMWLIGAVAYFIGGLFMSEVLFATATEEELQPVIDGLAFDEALLGGLLVGVVVVLATWLVMRPTHTHRPSTP